jgi:hypothetical protein
MKLLAFLPCLFVFRASAQDSALLGRLTQMPLHYVVMKTGTPPRIDGTLNDPAWQKAAWTGYFNDIEGDIRPTPKYHTRVKMLWDDQYLYVGAELEEPQVWSNVAHHDEVVFQDNDFEVFVNPENNAKHYFEIEINALATIFDLFLPESYRNGGNALIPWDVRGLKKAVHVNGTLNHPGDTDRGWTVEMAIPIADISMGNHAETPVPGSLWRINFSRVEWDTKVAGGKYIKETDSASGRTLPEHNWVWSPQGVIDMHLPERWGYLLFSNTDTAFALPYAERIKNELWRLFYQEQMYRQTHAQYTDFPGMPKQFTLDGKTVTLTAEATPRTFFLSVACPETKEAWKIDPKGNIERERF